MFNLDSKKIRSIMILVFLASAFWAAFGPVQVGGPVAYVIISGNSMEPEIKLGDLVLARRAPRYTISQAVVYQHPQIGFVYHRIIDREGDSFILKGDNNDWLDSYQPSEAEVLGAHWFVIPGAGNWVRTLREPLNFTLFAFIIIIIGVSIYLIPHRENIRKKIRGSEKIMKRNQPLSAGDTRQELLLFIAVLAMISIIFGLVTFTKPLTQVVSNDLVYFHQGEFSYTAVDADNVYDSDQIQTGEPVYTQLTCEIEMDFGYNLIPLGMGKIIEEDFTGTYLVDAVISDVDGWKRTFNLIPETDFEGTVIQSEMEFDLCAAQGLILDKEQKTETTNRWYDFTIFPRIAVAGTIDGLRLEDNYHPAIGFQLDSNILRMAEGQEGLNLSQEGRIEATQVVNNTMQLFGREITIVLARRIGALGLVFCLLAAVLPAWSLYKDWRASDVSRIQVQYHPLLVDIQEGSLSSNTDQIVDVASFADLTKMAERYGAMIFHEKRSAYHRYSVQDEQVVYQYILDGTGGESLFPDAYVFKRSLLEGLKEDQFELYYQPVMSIKDRKVVGVEAFLRWNHPQHGLIYPVDFIELAESGNLIPEIDSWVTRRVCQQLKEWQEGDVPVVPVSINLSPETVIDEVFIDGFRDMVQQTVCKPDLIQVEINRSNQVFQDKRIQDHLASLTDLGIALAIDNFATNDANQINQVFQSRIQSLKIDRSVVQEMKTDAHAKQLVGAVAAMAKKFQVQVIAQGVESEQDLDLLQEQGIKIAQGFYLGKPILPDELGSLLGKKKQTM